MAHMHGGNDFDYPGVILKSYRQSSWAIGGRPVGRQGEYNLPRYALNLGALFKALQFYLLTLPSRIQEIPPSETGST